MVSLFLSKHDSQVTEEQESFDRASLEMYHSFMEGYVRRINEATFKVAIGGIRIGFAKYSRLAQINLKTRVMTFSKYAIENVPERGRRYLVLHELAHVKESSHNRHFWDLVGRFEPNYRQVGRHLEIAFKRNVEKEDSARKGARVIVSTQGSSEQLKSLLGSLQGNYKQDSGSTGARWKPTDLADETLPDDQLIQFENLDCLADDLS